jgi:hypothetical protein
MNLSDYMISVLTPTTVLIVGSATILSVIKWLTLKPFTSNPIHLHPYSVNIS